MSDTWAIRLPLTKPLSLNDRQHWAVKARAVKQLRGDTLLLVRQVKIPPHQRIAVGLTYYPRTRHKRDGDNLTATMKPAVDALVDAGVVPDDDDGHVYRDMPTIAAPDGDPRLVLVVHGLEAA